MLEATYTVQNPHMTPSATRAIINGVEMTATVDAYEVELVSNNLTHSGIKLRFIGAEVDGAKELFKVDTKIKVQFSAAGEAAPAAPQ